jgi:hypothetical protein
VMTIFGNHLEDVIRNPKVETFLVISGLIAVIVLLAVWVRRRFRNGDSFAATNSPTDVSPHG